jgi:hypothetical protein
MRPGRRERAQPPLQQGYESTTQWNFKTHWCFHSGEVPRHFFTTWSKAQALLVAASFAPASQVQTLCSLQIAVAWWTKDRWMCIIRSTCSPSPVSRSHFQEWLVPETWDLGNTLAKRQVSSLFWSCAHCHRCCSRKGGDAAAVVPACREKHRVGSDRDTPSIHSCQSPSLLLSAKTPAWNFRLFLQNLLNLDTPFCPSSMKHYCLDVSFKDRTYFKFIGFYQNSIY